MYRAGWLEQEVVDSRVGTDCPLQDRTAKEIAHLQARVDWFRVKIDLYNEAKVGAPKNFVTSLEKESAEIEHLKNPGATAPRAKPGKGLKRKSRSAAADDGVVEDGWTVAATPSGMPFTVYTKDGVFAVVRPCTTLTTALNELTRVNKAMKKSVKKVTAYQLFKEANGNAAGARAEWTKLTAAAKADESAAKEMVAKYKAEAATKNEAMFSLLEDSVKKSKSKKAKKVDEDEDAEAEAAAEAGAEDDEAEDDEEDEDTDSPSDEEEDDEDGDEE